MPTMFNEHLPRVGRAENQDSEKDPRPSRMIQLNERQAQQLGVEPGTRVRVTRRFDVQGNAAADQPERLSMMRGMIHCDVETEGREFLGALEIPVEQIQAGETVPIAE